jgi:hypothetical protein
VIGDTASYPSYAVVSQTSSGTNVSNANVTASSSSYASALQKAAAGSTTRISAAWFGSPSFTVDVNLTDGQTHQLALYVPPLSTGNSEQINIYDASGTTLLDSRTVPASSGGEYLVWNVSGHVLIKITNTNPNGGYAYLSGLFFDPVKKTV